MSEWQFSSTRERADQGGAGPPGAPASAGARHKPGLKGPAQEIIAAIVEITRRNPRFGYQPIAEQIGHVFGVPIDKDIVRRVLSSHYRLGRRNRSGPSWRTFFA